MKTCSKCKRVLSLSEFGKDKNRQDGLYPQCKECRNLGQRNKYHSDEELRKTKYLKTRQRLLSNPEQYQAQIERQRAWYQKNYQDPEFREKEHERGKRYYYNNPEKIRVKSKKLWEKISSNPERKELSNANHREYVKDKYHNDPEFKKANRDFHTRRRAIKRSNGGDFAIEQWLTLCDLAHNKCLCCRKRRKLSIDHIVPVSLGGTSNIDNLQPLCRSCNASKGTQSIDYRTPVILEWLESEKNGKTTTTQV